MLTISTSEFSSGSVMANGNSSAAVFDVERPGSTPTRNPTTTPKTSHSSGPGCISISRPAVMLSSI